MSVFPHNELKYYFFGLRAGFGNLFANGLRLGVKKTLGKIAQPINAPSRFPEYYCFDRAIREHLSLSPSERPFKILDVGSPKTLGLYLGQTTRAEVTLTDISELNVDEYRVMWDALRKTAKGSTLYSLQDVRSLRLPADEFDVVYSMSVIEHVDGEAGDSQAVRELLRVLKPGGLLVLSVPFGGEYLEQRRIGVSGAARKTGDKQDYFFQRIYDPGMFRKRILEPAADLQHVSMITVARRNPWLSRGLGSLGENVRGALGFLNPILSPALNRMTTGLDVSFATSYGQLHSPRDVYGDLILTGHKR